MLSASRTVSSPPRVVGAGLLCSLFVLAACGVNEQVHLQVIKKLKQCQSKVDTCESARDTLQYQLDAAQGKLGEEAKLRAGAQSQLAATSKNLEQTESQLAATSEELAELRKQREAAEKRLAAYRDLNARMKKLVDTGKLSVAFRNGQMVLELPSEILFPSGRHKLSKRGEEALAEVADVLVEFKDRRFMIAGHTDNQPIKTRRFPNNWHLSTARAVSVVEFFVGEGFEAKNLGAAGFGEFDPVTDNDSPEGRKRNRRIEIILVPDLSELPNLTADG